MAAALAFLKAIWKGLRAIPWKVYAVAALALAFWLHGQYRYNAGAADTDARWRAAQVAADQKASADRARRDQAATVVNTATAAAAKQDSADTRAETAAAAERVKYVTRTIEVPANCPVALPDSVRDEGRAAVERARAAGSALRARGNP